MSVITLVSSTFNPANTIQKNAHYSWRHAGIPPLLVGETDLPHCGKPTCACVKTESDLGFPGNSPIVPDMVGVALDSIQTPMVGLINSDILIQNDFHSVLERIIEKYGQDIFLTSVRFDTKWKDPIDNPETLKEALNSPVTLHQDASADLFITSKYWFQRFSMEYPDFIFGRLCWDNAIHVYFKNQDIPCFNTSNLLKIFHQEHGYEHMQVSDFNTIQRNPSMNPSTNHNCHLFGRFMMEMKTGMSDIPRVKSVFSEPEI